MIRFGYRRLYKAQGYSLATQDELYFSMSFGSFEAHVCFGPQPKRDATMFNDQKHVVKNELLKSLAQEVAPSASNPIPLFIDVVFWKDVEVNEDFLYDTENVLQLAQQHAPDLAAEMYALVGTIGLLVHPHFVSHVVGDSILVCKDGVEGTLYTDYLQEHQTSTAQEFSLAQWKELAAKLIQLAKGARKYFLRVRCLWGGCCVLGQKTLQLLNSCLFLSR